MKPLISLLDKDQVTTGSSTYQGFQVMSLGKLVANKLSLGVTLGLGLSPNSLLPRSFYVGNIP